MEFVKLGSLHKAVAVQLRSNLASEFKTYKKRLSHDLNGPISAFSVSSDDKSVNLLLASNTRVLQLSLTSAGFVADGQSSRHKDRVTTVTWRQDGKLFASGDASGLVLICSPSLGVLRRVQAHSGPVSALVLTQSTLFTAGKDGKVICWDAATGQQLPISFSAHSDSVTKLALIPDSSILVSSSLDGSLRLSHAHTGICQGVFTFGTQIDSFAICQRGLMIFLFGGNKASSIPVSAVLQSPDHDTASCVVTSGLCHTRNVTSAIVLSSGDAFISTSADGTAKIRSTRDLTVLHTWADFEGGVAGVAIVGEKIILLEEGGKLVVRERAVAPELAGQEAVHIVGRKSNKYEPHVDFLFRKFEYKKVAQMLVSAESGMTYLQALAAVDELMQRDALKGALKSLSVSEMSALLDWAVRGLTAHPEHTGLILEFVETAMDENPQVLRNPALVQPLEKLRGRAIQEISIIEKLAPLVGMVQALMLA